MNWYTNKKTKPDKYIDSYLDQPMDGSMDKWTDKYINKHTGGLTVERQIRISTAFRSISASHCHPCITLILLLNGSYFSHFSHGLVRYLWYILVYLTLYRPTLVKRAILSPCFNFLSAAPPPSSSVSSSGPQLQTLDRSVPGPGQQPLDQSDPRRTSTASSGSECSPLDLHLKFWIRVYLRKYTR